MAKPGSHEHAFEEAVPQIFDGIISRYNFSSTTIYDGIIELKSEDCSVMIVLEKRQILVWIKPIRLEQVPGERYFTKLPLGWILYYIAPQEDYVKKSILAVEDLYGELERAAKLLEKYCTSFLAGDFSDWAKIRDKEY